MKLTKTTWIFLIVVVLLVAAVGLGMTRSRQASQKDDLEQQLAQANKKLSLSQTADLAEQKDRLTQQINQSNARIASSRGQLSSSEDSISATNIILTAAADCNVDIVSIGSSAVSSEKLAGLDFSTLPMAIDVQGEFNSITNFVVELSQKFPTGTAKVVSETAAAPRPSPSSTPTATGNVTAPTPTPTPSLTPAKQPVSATISLVIYNYGGK